MVRTTLLGLVATLGLAAATANASPLLSYNDAQVAYTHTFYDAKEADDGNGLDVELRYSPVDSFFIEGGYGYESTGIKNTDIDLDENSFTYGVGYWYPIQEDLHIVAHGGGIHSRVKVSSAGGSISENDNGYYMGAQLRGKACDNLEVDLGVDYVNFSNTSGSWNYSLTGLVPVADTVALVGEVIVDDDTDVGLLAGVRVEL